MIMKTSKTSERGRKKERVREKEKEKKEERNCGVTLRN